MGKMADDRESYRFLVADAFDTNISSGPVLVKEPSAFFYSVLILIEVVRFKPSCRGKQLTNTVGDVLVS